MHEPESLPDPVDEALLETFPASDPPAWWAGPSRSPRSAQDGIGGCDECKSDDRSRGLGLLDDAQDADVPA